MSIKGVLLAGASLCTICAGTAFAKSAPHLVAALHANAGRVTVKTGQHPHQFTNLTSTFAVSTGVTSADYKVKTPLAQTYYTFLHSGTFCNPPKEKVVLATKKTKYAKLSTSVESYSEGCGTPSQFFGDEYDLQTKKTPKKPDTFVSSLEAKKVHFNGTVYKKATLNLDVSVTISK